MWKAPARAGPWAGRPNLMRAFVVALMVVQLALGA